MRNFTEPLLTVFAQGVGWENITISYKNSSLSNEAELEMTTGAIIGLTLTCIGMGVTFFAMAFELLTWGDREDLRDPETRAILYDASKFRRLT